MVHLVYTAFNRKKRGASKAKRWGEEGTGTRVKEAKYLKCYHVN